MIEYQLKVNNVINDQLDSFANKKTRRIKELIKLKKTLKRERTTKIRRNKINSNL